MALDSPQLSLRRLAGRFTGSIDGPLFTLALILVVIGLATLYSASYEYPARVTGQLANLAVAFTAMWVFAHLAPQTLMRFAVPAYFAGLQGNLEGMPWPQVAAGALIFVAPIVLFTFLVRRHLLRGMTFGTIKQ